MKTLLTKLYGSQSWGTKSRFNFRDAGHEPSKSAFGGIVVAAIDYKNEEKILKAFNSCRMGVRVDQQGVLKEEFCTAGGGTVAGKDFGAFGAATEDLSSPHVLKNAIIVKKQYWQDACFLVGLEGDECFLENVEEALRCPKLLISLGRRQYEPREPLWIPPSGMRDAKLEDALRLEPWLLKDDPAFKDREPSKMRCVVEVPMGSRKFTRIIEDVALDYQGPRDRATRAVLDYVFDRKPSKGDE